LKEEFEELLKTQERIIKEGEPQEVTISHIHLQFENAEIIKMMLKRGHALATGVVWEQIRWEMEIKKHYLEHKDKLKQPADALITFKTEEAFQRAAMIETYRVCGKEQAVVEWKGTNLDFEFAKEPSNIIYTNLYQGERSLFWKKICVGFLLFLLLLLTCVVLFSTQKVSSKLSKYFPNVDCVGLKHDL
jgi:hypothetical protein